MYTLSLNQKLQQPQGMINFRGAQQGISNLPFSWTITSNVVTFDLTITSYVVAFAPLSVSSHHPILGHTSYIVSKGLKLGIVFVNMHCHWQ